MSHLLRNTCCIAALLVAGNVGLRASAFDVTINASSLDGTNGGIYFQFSPGLNADPASVSITNFLLTSPGALNSASPLNFSDGGASGSLDAGNLTIANSFALNDYGEALEFGSLISFVVTLNTPSVLHGDSGSALSIQVTGPDLLTPLLTSDPAGNLVDIAYDQTGSLNVLSTSSNAGVTQVSATPEPRTFATIAAVLLFSSWRIARSRSSRPANPGKAA
jgi:hypothetical protein